MFEPVTEIWAGSGFELMVSLGPQEGKHPVGIMLLLVMV